MKQYINHKQSTGYSLIELMVTITLGSFLILGASYAFQEASKTYRTNDNVAKLYEQAQYAISVLEEDIRLSNFWGLHTSRPAVIGDAGASDYPVAAGLNNIAGDCINGWALNLSFGVEGSNELLPAWAGLNCGSDFNDATDTFIVRRSDTTEVLAADLDEGQVYVRSNESPASRLFLGNNGAPNLGPDAKSFEYYAHGYYVTNNSKNGTDKIPTLMRAALVDNGVEPAVETQEVIRGVEDFQIQYGMDYGGKSGLRGLSREFGMVDQYVNPDSPLINARGARVISMRFWLLLRAEQTEQGYTDTNTYNYASINDYQPNDGFRRLLVSKTVKFRNMNSND